MGRGDGAEAEGMGWTVDPPNFETVVAPLVSCQVQTTIYQQGKF